MKGFSAVGRGGRMPGMFVGMGVLAPLLPIFLLVGVGAALVKLGFHGHDFRRGLERFVYWVALPALLVVKLSEVDAIGGDTGRMFMAIGAATCGTAALAVLGAWVWRMPGATAGAFIQSACRGNIAFTALPVVALASQYDPQINAKAALVLGPLVVLFNAISVTALIATRQRPSIMLPFRLLRSTATNPMILACVLGLGLSATTGPLPGPVHATLDLLGRTAAPLALICLGGAMLAYRVNDHLKLGLGSAVLKLAVTPALVWAFAAWLGVTGSDLRTVMVFAAAPTAVASYVLTTQLKGDAGLAAATIVLSTALSMLSLAVALALTG